MAIEMDKLPKKNNKHLRRGSTTAKSEFEKLVLKNVPGWTAVWSVLLQECKEMSRKKIHGTTGPLDLQKKIRRKISELLDKEETLVHLYKRAAEAAKKKEEEFKDKTAILIQQIEKDKNFMKAISY